MHVLKVRNVNDALVQGMALLHSSGVERASRNGSVLQFPVPVATVYERPLERVLFHPERDANPFFHLYEALWMLAGRADVEGPGKFVKQMYQYSDDGKELWGAYGRRWRSWFGRDQLDDIIGALGRNEDDRRCVLQMWDPRSDLGRDGRDVPCNITCTFQVRASRALTTQPILDLVVFCRSNDIIWGAYGANAVHFSMLLEYLAEKLNMEVGTMTQISVNYHAYRKVFDSLWDKFGGSIPTSIEYERFLPCSISTKDDELALALQFADGRSEYTQFRASDRYSYWLRMVCTVFQSYFTRDVSVLDDYRHNDWAVAARQWLQRRTK